MRHERRAGGPTTLFLSAVLGLAGAVPATLGAAPSGNGRAADRAAQAGIEAQVNRALNLRSSRLVSLEVAGEPGQPLMTVVPIDGVLHTLDLFPHSIQADGYRVLAQVEDGSLVDVAPGPDRSLRGAVMEIPDSQVAASLLDDGLHAMIVMPLGDRYWVEPVAFRVPGADPALHVVYHDQDVIESGAACGVIDAKLPVEPLDIPAGGGVAGTGGICTTELACDADFEYFQSYGSNVTNVENRINFIINTVNLQYESQVSITHAITAIVVRSSSNDPYTSNDSGTLLTQFRNEWLNNQGGIQRDVAKLFTARSINGGIIGQAWTLGAICVTSSHYCYSWSDCCGSTACATDLAAHELGHLWNAVHCSCPSNTMNPFITCTNNFSAQSIAAIIGHRDSRTCLDGDCSGGGPEPPANDDCANATPVTNGTIGFTNIAATTDGPNEPGSCNFFSYTHIDSDVWFRYAATCNGTVSVSLCGSGYDTKLAVYGADCPASSGLTLACNDDSCGLQSEVSFTATAGAQYLIRIGGYNGAQGNGSMTITCGGGGGSPANDNCANAFAILEGDTAFTNINANTDGPSLPGSCDEDNGLSFQSDVWYVYEPVGNGTLTVSTCSQAAFDTRLAAYTGTCTGLVLTTCNDDGAGCTGFTSLMEVPVACDEPVLIRVGAFGAVQGNGTLSLTYAGGDCGPAAPPNDNCANAVVVSDGTTPFTTTGATTDGPDEPALCESAGFSQVDNDIWYKYVASCDGDLTVSLCGSTYDTKLAVYAGGCPVTDGTAIACNDDSCGLESELVVAVTAAQQYRIRVGGFLGASGDGTLSISCDTPPPTCLGDTNGDSMVDVDDLTAVILDWGSCPGCPADLNGDDLVNVDDLTLIILNWGPCVP